MKATKAAIRWPVVSFEGREKIRIYRRENKTRGYPFYQFADYSSGKRKMRSFGDLENAKNEARRIVKLLSRGDAYAASMTAKDRTSYVRAVELALCWRRMTCRNLLMASEVFMMLTRLPSTIGHMLSYHERRFAL